MQCSGLRYPGFDRPRGAGYGAVAATNALRPPCRPPTVFDRMEDMRALPRLCDGPVSPSRHPHPPETPTTMTLKGWTLPQTPTGKSSLLPPPPWHYSGEIISVDFTADPERVAELLPPGMTPMGDGSASFVFADWCSAADHDPRIRDDPAVGQYREAYCVLYGLFEEKKVSRTSLQVDGRPGTSILASAGQSNTGAGPRPRVKETDGRQGSGVRE